MINYQVEVIDTNGNRKYLIPDIASGSFTHRVNDIGDFTLELMTNDPNYPFLRDEVVRIERYDSNRDGFSVFTPRFDGLHLFEDLTQRNGATGQRLTSYVSAGPDAMDILARPIINYPEGSAQAKKSADALTVIHAYVNENLGPFATIANGRAFDMEFAPLSILTPSDTTINYFSDNARQELVDTLQTIAEYVLQQTGEPIIFKCQYLSGYQFQFFAVLPIDRTAKNINPTTGKNASGNEPVILGLDHGTITELRRVTDWRREGNVITALGKGVGDGDDQRIIVRSNGLSSFNAPMARRERAISATRLDTDAEIRAEADNWLSELEARPRFYVSLGSTSGQHLWYDYEIGDLVSLYDADRREFWRCWVTSYQVDIQRPSGGLLAETVTIELMALDKHD